MRVCYRNSLDAVVDNQESEFETNASEACRLLERLLFSQSSLFVEASDTCNLDFYVEDDNSLWVEITGLHFWAISEIGLEAGQEIIRIACAGSAFSDLVPVLNREWDAYSRF